MTNLDIIRPCPFCGSSPVIKETSEGAMVCCRATRNGAKNGGPCNVTVKAPTRNLALANWNRRVEWKVPPY